MLAVRNRQSSHKKQITQRAECVKYDSVNAGYSATLDEAL